MVPYINSQLSRLSIARVSGPGFSLEGPTKAKASKSGLSLIFFPCHCGLIPISRQEVS